MVPHGEVHLVELLGAGSHCHPRVGGCLLELVSTVPGGPWTDSPAGLDGTLAYVARAVNDLTGDAERAALAPLIPSLAELAATPPADVLATAEAVAAAALRAAGAVSGPAPVLRGGPRWLNHAARRHAALRTVRSAVHTVARGATADAALRDLLAGAVDATRRLHGLPPGPALTRPAGECRVRVPVETRLLGPCGPESLFTHSKAVLAEWPDWLRPPSVDGIAAARGAGRG